MKEVLSIILSGKTYGVDVSHMRGIENYIAPTKIGKEGDLLLGVVMIRNEQIPIVDVKKRMALPPEPVTDATKVLLLNTEHGCVGILVDSVSGIFRAEGDDVQDFPLLMNAENTSYGEYIARNGKDLVITISPSNLMVQEDWKKMEEYRESLEKEA